MSDNYIAKAKPALESAIEAENESHLGTDHADHAMVLLCSLYDKVFIELFDNQNLTLPFNLILA